MAISLDVASGNSTSSASSQTDSVTVASGSNRRMIVAVANNAAGGIGPVDPTGITYDSVALTKIASQGATVSGDNNVSLWELVAPNVGAANVVTSFGQTQDFIDVGWVVLQGASQSTTPHDTTEQSSEDTQNPTISVVSTFNNCWAVSIGYPKDNPAGGTITGATEFMGAFFSDGGYSGPESTGTISHTYAGDASTEDWILGMVAVAPVEADAQVRSLAALGVG